MKMTKTTYEIINKGKDEAEILIYDVIGESMFEESTSAKNFVKQLKDLKDVKNIALRINSPGGSVFDGSVMYNAIAAHPAKVTSYIDGFAASSASWIALAADEVVMAENAMMMIHDPAGVVMGGADDMRKQADVLDKIKGSIVNAYQAKTGRTPQEISDAMAEESWYNAEEAVAFGLADRVAEGRVVTNALSEDFVSMLNGYANVPSVITNVLVEGRADAGEESRQPNNDEQESQMDPKILKLLGLPETATQEEYDAALDAHIAAQEAASQGGEGAGGTDEGVAGGEGAAAATTPAPTNALPAGMVAVDEATLAALKANAEKGVAAFNNQVKVDRDKVIADALADGKFPQERAEHWRNQLDLDPGVQAVIEAMPKNLCVPVGAQLSGAQATNLAAEGEDVYPSGWLTEAERARITNNKKEA